jgi:hypothetical protein
MAGVREGEAAASVHTMTRIRDNSCQGKAADREVRLKAAQGISQQGIASRM